jgi:hypothetical protein
VLNLEEKCPGSCPSSFFLIGEVSPKREIKNFKIKKKVLLKLYSRQK